MGNIYFDRRNSGIPLIGDILWGTSFCQFYQTEQDLLSILLPYFIAGLQNNEACVWVTTDLAGSEAAQQTLAKGMPDFEKYAASQQMEIIPYERWHADSEKPENVTICRLDNAICRGFEGLRIAVNFPRGERDAGTPSGDAGLGDITRYNVIVNFTYPREHFDAAGLMEVVKNHRLALVHDGGRLEVIESSEARIVKDALSRSEEKLRSLFSHMAEGFAYNRIILDSNGEPCDFVFLEINDAFEKILGLKAKDVIGRRVTAVLPGIEKDRIDWIGRYGRVALTGQPDRFESYSETLQKWYSVSAFCTYKGFFGVTFSDITESKVAEEALRASEQRWATTLASIGDAVIATDVAGRITFMNAVAEALTGWALREAFTLPVTDVFRIIDEKSRQEVENPVTRVLRESVIVNLANHTVLVRKDGTDIPVDDSGAPIKDRDGTPLGVILVFRDVTARRKAEQIKDEFISMVSHELKTPLTVIIGALSVALAEGIPEEQRRELMQDAVTSASSMATIVENLLELSRHQSNRLSLKSEQTDVARIAMDVVKRLQATSPTHHISVDIPDTCPVIMVDRVRVERVLNNLTENAIKYSPGGGEVKIFARCENDHVVVGVRDQGMGISPENQRRLFQSFERLDRQEQRNIPGLGLGLRVCRILVEAHGGKIWVESQPGNGSTFYFTLPCGR